MASNLYLLPCDACQHSISLQKPQAGQTVNCPQCGYSFDAPRLGEFKNLQQVDPEPDSAAIAGSPSILKRWMFTLGLAMAVLFAAAGFGVYQFANSIQHEIDADGALQAYDSDIDGLTDAEVYQIAAAYNVDQSIGEYFQPDLVKNNKQGAILQYIAYGLLGLAGVGLVMLTGSFFVK